MGKDEERRSDRINLTIPIRVAGTDAVGYSFVDDARTVVVTRHGAKILAARKLAPDQEVSIHCVLTGLEVDARVLGQIGEEVDGYYYGVSFLDDSANPWGIQFPALETGKVAVGRAVLECVGCKTREVAYLDEFEVEVLEANSSITRYCMRCTESTLWKKSKVETVTAEPEVEEAEAETGQEKRREPRRELRVRACIRSQEFGDEIVWTRNVSRGGLCFESLRRYAAHWKVDVSIPYSPGGGNIFLPARIARVQGMTASDVVLCGVAYIRNPRTP